jgi:hypothetical protein
VIKIGCSIRFKKGNLKEVRFYAGLQGLSTVRFGVCDRQVWSMRPSV